MSRRALAAIGATACLAVGAAVVQLEGHRIQVLVTVASLLVAVALSRAFWTSPTVDGQTEPQILAHTTDAIIGYDRNLIFTSWNRAAEATYGWKRSEAVGRPASEIFGAPFVNATLAGVFPNLEQLGRSTGEVVHRRKDGTLIDIEASTMAVRDAGGALSGAVSVHRDISQRKRVERAQQLQARLYGDLLKAQSEAGEGVVITEGERIVYANEALGRIYGYSVRELIGLGSFLDLIVPEERLMVGERLRHFLSGGGLPSDFHEATVERKDGRRVNIEFSIRPNQRGATTQLFAIIRDVTERKLYQRALEASLDDAADARDQQRQRAEDLVLANQRIIEQQLKLVQAEQLSCIGKLAAGVAHEINNPVTGLMACVRLLQDGEIPLERQQEYFAVMGNALKQIATTVSALTSYARDQPAGLSAIDPGEMISSCLPLLSPLLQARRIALAVQRRETAQVLGNGSQLCQASMNILLNAIHASPPHTEVTVSIYRKDDRIALAFADRGRGIPKAMLGRVCDPFFTGGPSGTSGIGLGLGLWFAKGILDAHGGELAIESLEGHGTTVTFWLKPAVS